MRRQRRRNRDVQRRQDGSTLQGRRRNLPVDNAEVDKRRLRRSEHSEIRGDNIEIAINVTNIIIIIIILLVITNINIISIENNESGREKRLLPIRRRKTCFFNRIDDDKFENVVSDQADVVDKN